MAIAIKKSENYRNWMLFHFFIKYFFHDFHDKIENFQNIGFERQFLFSKVIKKTKNSESSRTNQWMIHQCMLSIVQTDNENSFWTKLIDIITKASTNFYQVFINSTMKFLSVNLVSKFFDYLLSTKKLVEVLSA